MDTGHDHTGMIDTQVTEEEYEEFTEHEHASESKRPDGKIFPSTTIYYYNIKL